MSRIQQLAPGVFSVQDEQVPPFYLPLKSISKAFLTPDLAALIGAWIQEIPSGAVDGINTSFTLSNTPISNASVSFYLNGLILIQGTDYTIAGAIITMTVAPAIGQKLYAVYQH